MTGREVLPIPDRRYEGLVTYDAKDPATSFPPIEPLRPLAITVCIDAMSPRRN